MTTQNIALALLACCVLALVVGVMNAINIPGEPEKVTVKTEDNGSTIATLLGKGGMKQDSLMLVELRGVITAQGESNSLFDNESPAKAAVKALNKASKTDSVKGVLLHIDSPGGTVGMSQELNAAVKRVVEKKPVVVSFGDVAASGGYYTAVAADKIITNPGTLTGSIGVIISTMNFKELTKKLGVQGVTIKSGKFKDILSPYRSPRPEEIQLVQDLIDTSYEQFLGAVIEGRTKYVTDETEKAKRIATIKAHADGRIILGSEAVKLGLADETGDQYHARKVLNQMAKERFNITGKKELPLERYSESASFLEELLGLASIQLSQPPSGASSLQGLVPYSLSHPYQPLWIME